MNFHKLAVITAVISLCTIVHIFGLERVAVVPFAVGDGVNPFVASGASLACNEALVSCGQYDVVAESDVFAAMELLSLQNVQAIDNAAAATIGKNVNADKIFIGSAANDSDKVQLTVKCIDVSTGDEIASKTAYVTNTGNSIPAAAKMMVSQINKGDINPNSIPQGMTDHQLIHIERLMNKCADISNGNDMKYWFHYYLRMGIAGAITDVVLTTVGAGFMAAGGALVAQYGNSPYWSFVGTGGIILGIDWIVAPILMVIGFVRMGRTYAIYRKTTGNKKFNPAAQISFGGGYDWKDKEATVSMAIKL